MELWSLAFKNLLRNPRRSIVTGLAIAIGYTGLNVFNGYVHQVERTLAITSIYLNHAGHFSIIKKGWFEKGLSKPRLFSLDQQDQTELSDFFRPYENDFFLKTPIFTGIGLISNGCRSLPFYIKGLERIYRTETPKAPEFIKWAVLEFKRDPKETYISFNDDDFPLMVTYNLSQLLNKKVTYKNAASLPPSRIIDCQKESEKEYLSKDPSVQLLAKSFSGGFAATDANIVSHYTVGFSFLDDISIEGPLSLTQKLYDTQSISRLIFFLKNPNSINHWKSKILPLFEKRFPKLEMVFFDDPRISPFYTGSASFLDSLTFLFILIAGISITLTIINSLTISILERSKEIGTFRALGFTNNQLAWLFGREMILLTSLSLFFGALFSVMTAFLINASGLEYIPPGASGNIPLRVSLEPQFLFISFCSFALLVLIVSYFLTKKRISVNTSRLLADS